MNIDLSKIYENLDPSQLALLAFNHLTDDNPLERQRILSAVPQRAYLTNDNRFTQMHMMLLTTLEKMSAIYWKSRAQYWERLYNGYDATQATETYNGIVLAIQHALETLGVIDDVIKVYFMTDDILTPILNDDVNWQIYDDYVLMLDSYL